MPQTRRALMIGIDSYPKIRGADLAGCVNDVALMKSILEDQFDFAPENIRTILDDQATRRNIKAGFAAFVDAVQPDDIAVIYYAGHGSRMRDPRAPREIIESMVSHDSGRGAHPNRDVLDREVDGWVRAINAKTPHLTLIFDCCHSGGVTRDLFGGRTRRVEPDMRMPEDWTGEDCSDEAPRTRSLTAETKKGAAGWIDRGNAREAVFIAACLKTELAAEYDRSEVPHGALTYFLSQIIRRMLPGATWRDVFEQVGGMVTAMNNRQHPVIEGKRDNVLFSAEMNPPQPYLRVTQVSGETVTLGGGAAHGVRSGGQYQIYPATAHGAGDADGRLGVVEVTAVRPTEADARIVPESTTTTLSEGLRAFGVDAESEEHRFRVAIDAPAEQADEVAAVMEALSKSGLFETMEGVQPADVLLRLIPPRKSAQPEDPCPQLGALHTWTWAGVGSDGRLAIHLREAGGGAGDALRGDLDKVVRYRKLIGIENTDPRNALQDALDFQIYRRTANGQLVPATGDGGMPLFEEGDLAEFGLTNRGSKSVYFSILEFGTDGAITVVCPSSHVPPQRNESLELKPGQEFRVARDHYAKLSPTLAEGLPLSLPENFPWAAEPGEEAASGVLTLKVLVTATESDFSQLGQGATRRPWYNSEFEAWVHQVNRVGSTRSFFAQVKKPEPKEDWAVLNRPIMVQRAGQGQALDPSGNPVELQPGLVVQAPGLAGTVRVDVGDSARTRDLEMVPNELELAFGDAGLRTVATVTVSSPSVDRTRSLGPAPQTDTGEDALVLQVAKPGTDWGQAVLSVDEAGSIRWTFPQEGAGETDQFNVPRPVAQKSDGKTRSLLGWLGSKVMRVVAWKIGQLHGVDAVRAWEAKRRPHRLRGFLPESYGEAEVSDLDPSAWARLATGPALLMIHGTFSSVHQGFGKLDAETVAGLNARYDGRVFAFDHPTLGTHPDDNLQWLIDQVPPEISLDLDVIAHSRGGLVGRLLAGKGRELSEGRVQVGRLITVGTPHAGTPMAQPDNLGCYLDVLSNAAAMVPIPILGDVFAILLEFAKGVAFGTAVNLPGLAVMRPDSRFLVLLEHAGLEGVETFAVGSKYTLGTHLQGIDKFVEQVVNGAVFKSQEHDLVVPYSAAVGAEQCYAADVENRMGLEGVVFGAVLKGAPWHGDYFKDAGVRETLLSWIARSRKGLA